MNYLLDVNALIALGFSQHEFHQRLANWTQGLASKGPAQLATCSITELGFIRVLAQAPEYGLTISQAQLLLRRLKEGTTPRFIFVSDDQDISRLPTWVKTAKQTTDGHLLQLARAHGATLATLDRSVPGAFLIPAWVS